jgi:hypothetical protein
MAICLILKRKKGSYLGYLGFQQEGADTFVPVYAEMGKRQEVVTRLLGKIHLLNVVG